MRYFFIRNSARVLLKILFRLRVEGVENVPREGPILIASNHISYLDPVAVGAVCPRELHYMARDDLFRIPFLSGLVKSCNAFPVKREVADTRAVKEALCILKAGKGLLIFPEGTRSPDGNLMEGRAGAGLLASGSKAVIVPTMVTGTERALPLGARWIRPERISVHFGEPFDPGEFLAGGDRHYLYQQISKEIMVRIASLKKRGQSPFFQELKKGTVPFFLAAHSGFCFGVKRAMRIAFETAEKEKHPIYSLGPLIHNPQAVEDLRRRGVEVVKDLGEVEGGVVIVRSHGVHPHLLEEARRKGLRVIDATCPLVRRVQRLGESLKKGGYEIIIVGEREHAEVKALLGYAGKEAMVVANLDEVRLLKVGKRIGIIAQTTQSVETFKQIAHALLQKAEEAKVFNTVCKATIRQQSSARRLTRKVDLMLVLGGYNSANTKELARVCKMEGTEVHHIEVGDEIEDDWLVGKRKVGVTAGASTPDWVIEKTMARLLNFA